MPKISDPIIPTVLTVVTTTYVPVAKTDGVGGFTDGKVLLGDLALLDESQLFVADTANAGLMTAANFNKLAGIAAGANNYVHPAHSGDVTSVSDGATTIAANAVTNAKAADVPTASFKGRATALTGDPEDLTVAQAKALLAYTAAEVGAAPTSHTHLAAAITDFAENVDDRVAALLVQGANVTLTYDDVLNTLTIAAAAGGGSAVAVQDEGVSITAALTTLNVVGAATATLTSPGVVALNIPAAPASVVAARVRRSTNQAIPTGAGFTDLVWDTLAHSTGGTFWTTGATTTVPETGVFQIFVEATFDGTGLLAMATANLQILLNGVTVIGEDEKQVLVNAKAAMYAMAQRSFTAGDTIKVQVKHSDANSVNVLAQGDHSPDIIFSKVGGAQGAGATPSGNSGEIQFNNAGAFAGAANVEIESGNLKLISTTTPAAPASDAVLFVKTIANSRHLFMIGPANEPKPFEEMLMRSGAGFWIPPGTAATLPAIFGYPLPTTTGFVATARIPASTNYFTRRMRLGYVTAATAGTVGHFRAAGQMFTIGSGAGVGGFKHVIRFGISDPAAVAGARMFLGVSTGGVPTNVEPNTLLNCIGIGHGAADTNFKIFYGGSAAQAPIDLGVNFPCNTLSVDAYELTLYAPPNTQTIHWEVTRLNTGQVASGTISGVVGTAVPSATAFLGPWGFRTNNATALAVALDIFRASLEICDE